MLKVKIVMTVEGVIEIDEDNYMEGTSPSDMLKDAIECTKKDAANDDAGFKILAIHGTILE